MRHVSLRSHIHIPSEGCNPPEGEIYLHGWKSLPTFTRNNDFLLLVEILFHYFAFWSQILQPFGSVRTRVLHLLMLYHLDYLYPRVVLRGREQELASLLIILRLWRLVKLVGGDRLHLCSMMSQLVFLQRGRRGALRSGRIDCQGIGGD